MSKAPLQGSSRSGAFAFGWGVGLAPRRCLVGLSIGFGAHFLVKDGGGNRQHGVEGAHNGEALDGGGEEACRRACYGNQDGNNKVRAQGGGAVGALDAINGAKGREEGGNGAQDGVEICRQEGENVSVSFHARRAIENEGCHHKAKDGKDNLDEA